MQNLYFLLPLQWILSIAYMFIRFAFRFLNEDRFVARRSDLDYDDDHDGDEDRDHDWWEVHASVFRMYAMLISTHCSDIVCVNKRFIVTEKET